MPLSQKEIAAAREVYEMYWDCYFSGNSEKFGNTIDPQFAMIGTSESEVSFGKTEAIEILMAQYDEVVGKAERRNRQIKEIPVGDMLELIEFCDIYVLIDSDWSFYSKFRLSTLLHKTPDGWKLLQQHGSLPDMRVGEGETVAVEKISKENLELRDAVKRRTIELENKSRDLEIEAALERVRSRSMAMQKSYELKEVIQLIYQQIVELGIHTEHAGIILDYKERDDMHIWLADGLGSPSELTIPYFDCPHWNGFVEAKKNGHQFFAVNHNREQKDDFYQKLFRFVPEISEDSKKTIYAYKGLAISTVLLKDVALYIENFDGIPYADAENETLLRFGKVFQQTYTRFLDLQKAEAQAQEAKIQLALERVRARIMAMHKSEELSYAAAEMFQQMADLSVTPERLNICFFHEEERTLEVWPTDEGGLATNKQFTASLDEPTTIFKAFTAWKEKKNSFIIDLHGKALKEWVAYVREAMGLTIKEETLNEHRIHTMVFFSHGTLMTTSSQPIPDKSFQLLERFTHVFDQAYVRFLDLQKAEAQAREAQIETAIEKVRASSMSIQKSDELIKVVQILNKEIKGLGIDVNNTQIITDFADSKKGLNIWFVAEGQDYLEKFHLNYVKHPISNEMVNATKNGTVFYKEIYSKKEKNEFLKLVFQSSDFINIPKERQELLYDAPGLVRAVVLSKNSILVFQRYYLNEFSKEQEEIFKRFGKVFEQAYTRFLDLQKAEFQAREAQIEAALEKVRSRSLAMQKSDELLAVIIELSSQLQQLNVRFDFVSFGVIGQENEIDFWMAGEGYTQPELYHMPYFDHFVTNSLLEDQKKGLRFSESTFNQKDTREWMEVLYENNPKSKMLADTKKHTRTGPGMVRASVILKNICVFMGNFRLKPHIKEQNALLIRFANAFEQAYTRFLDLQKAEAQAEQAEENLKTIKAARAKAEEALIELKAAQNQLIQAEKLASLGQLTAGIAHEIKNPLNFVNNFSELNVELIDEVFEELEKLEASESSDLMAEILEDVKSNLTKIHEHGTRADGIVKSMLQHSRGSSGKIEPTNLNSLIKEYTNLAFHGMRAGKNPINVEIDLQLDSSITDIPLISEDFTRVILNLCNNAFDAMRETESRRSPKLTVRTQKTDKHISIEVGDNGSGIPDDIKEKILQPFFTTKKGTDGTGLGLSITNDIIKAHGGEITIDSSQGKGTTFSIHLSTKGL